MTSPEVSGWSMMSSVDSLTLVWKVMLRCVTFIHLRAAGLPWYTAGPWHRPSPHRKHDASRPRPHFLFCTLSPSLLHFLHLQQRAQMRNVKPVTMEIRPRPSIIPITLSLFTYNKAQPVAPCHGRDRPLTRFQPSPVWQMGHSCKCW